MRAPLESITFKSKTVVVILLGKVSELSNDFFEPFTDQFDNKLIHAFAASQGFTR